MQTISKSTFKEFAKHISTYFELDVVSEIAIGAGIDLDKLIPFAPPTSIESLMEELDIYLNLSHPDDRDKLLDVFEVVLFKLHDRASSGWHNDQLDSDVAHLEWYLSRDGYKFENQRIVSAPINLPSLDTEIRRFAETCRLPDLQRTITRLAESIEEDPALAIGSSKELIESVCKSILIEKGIECKPNINMPQLIDTTMDALQLRKDKANATANVDTSIDSLLTGLADAVKALNKVRNAAGTGHGRSKNAALIQPRHAKLCVRAAFTIATFFLETDTRIKSPKRGQLENQRSAILDDSHVIG